MRQNGKRRSGPIVMIVSGLVLLILAAATAPIALQLMRPTAASLPPSLAGMPMQGAIYAAEAIETIDQMHAKSFALSSAAVGAYGSLGEAFLYISGAPTEWLAKRMTEEMTQRIAENETPYTPLGEEVIGGTRVYILEGHGQQHFYFRSGKLLVWLAADAWLATPAIEECLRFYTGASDVPVD